MRYPALVLTALTLISCSRDPNVLKAKYVESGKKYYEAERYKEASIMFRKAIEADRKYGLGYYHLALTDLKLGSVPAAVPALRRSHELLKAGTKEADDTDLKLSEIMIVASQSQEHAEPIIKEVQGMVDGLLKRNPDSWQGHKLTGDLAMLDTARLFRAQNTVDAKKRIGDAVAEYRKALGLKAGDPVITLALGRPSVPI